MGKFWVVLGLLGAMGASGVGASEGTAELRNLVREDARCWVGSVLMTNFHYRLIVSCRDLVYPVEQGVFEYALWVEPVGGGKARKMGTLGVGKAEFSTNQAFSGLYVTKEGGTGVGEKTQQVVMRGTIRPITYLERKPTEAVTRTDITPSPTGETEGIVGQPAGSKEIGEEQAGGGIVRVGIAVLRALGILFLVGISVAVVVIVVSSLKKKV